MYGRLEDETSFSSVRRLLLAEDHALRLLDDLGFHVAHSYGVIELTPNQEYLIPTGHAEVDDAIIDDGIALVRKLWDTGLAHRDIKPANLLVVEGRLQVIDVSGLEVRPSPWRQAVDLANMMLVLALRSDPDRVYERALRSFTPEDIGEAFAVSDSPSSRSSGSWSGPPWPCGRTSMCSTRRRATSRRDRSPSRGSSRRERRGAAGLAVGPGPFGLFLQPPGVPGADAD